MCENIKLIRQGDVYLKRISELPKGLKKKDNVLALGEKTGHKHQFLNEGVETFVNNNGNQFCLVKTDSSLVHEEHASVGVKSGVYEVLIQREFDPVEGIRQVMD